MSQYFGAGEEHCSCRREIKSSIASVDMHGNRLWHSDIVFNVYYASSHEFTVHLLPKFPPQEKTSSEL